MDRKSSPTAKLYVLLPGQGVVEASGGIGDLAGMRQSPSPVAALEARYDAAGAFELPGRGRMAVTGMAVFAGLAALVGMA